MSRQNVIKLGASPQNSYVVGSFGLDDIKNFRIPSRKELAGILKINSKKKWFLFLHHPAPFENVPIHDQINPALQALKKLRGEKIIEDRNMKSKKSILHLGLRMVLI